MSEKYANGKANATEYNEARTNWMKAVSDMLQAKYDYLFRTKILDFYKEMCIRDRAMAVSQSKSRGVSTIINKLVPRI